MKTLRGLETAQTRTGHHRVQPMTKLWPAQERERERETTRESERERVHEIITDCYRLLEAIAV
jgi:hypothetical protein